MFEHYKWADKLPSVNKEEDNHNLLLFYSTLKERLLIWKKRFVDQQPRPWTHNEILRDYKFTNVYRELDRSSQWQIKNIILDDSLKGVNLIWKLLFYRTFNAPENFEEGLKRGWANGIPDWRDWNKDEYLKFLKQVRSQGINPFTNAYLVNSGGVKIAAMGLDRDENYCYRVLPDIHKKIPRIISLMKNATTPQELVKFLQTIPSISTFMAHEYYQDMTYLEIYSDRKMMRFTQNDFTNVGPGASLGLRLIFPSLSGKNQIQGIYTLRDRASVILREMDAESGVATPFVRWNRETRKYDIVDECNLTLHQIEMWLCEFQKYWKMSISEGKQRSKFQLKTKELIVK